MDFVDVIKELSGLKGMVLKSIRPGADITLLDVKEKEESLVIRDSKGRVRSRPFSEIHKVWDALAQKPAAHVDSVLGGSGTSRNQPETIFANLPFVEYLLVNNRKYIALVSEKTHNPGTVRQMDLVKAESVKSRLTRSGDTSLPWTAVLIVPELQHTIVAIESTSGISPEAVSGEPYARQISLAGTRLLIVGPDPAGHLPLPAGTYPVICAPSGLQEVERVRLCGIDLWIKDIHGARVLVLD